MTETKEIDQIQFGVLSHAEIVNHSVAEITKNKLSNQKTEFLYDTVYDPRMGPMESNQSCVTCGLTSKDCPGHFGHIVLNVKVVHPLYYRQLVQVLRCVCFRCSRLLVTDSHIELWNLHRHKGEQRFLLLQERLEKIRYCSHCNIGQPRYSVSIAENAFFMVYKSATKVRISTDHLYLTVSKISDDDVRRMGFDPEIMRPVNLILTALPVIPPRARPFIMSSENISDDDLTLSYCEIVKLNNILESRDLTDLKRQRYTDALTFRIRCLFDNSAGKAKHTNFRPYKGFKERLSGKDGLIRNNLMGKRVNCSARTVISPDPTLKLNEIAVPLEICATLSRQVTVNPLNIQTLQQRIYDGQVNMIDSKRDDKTRRVHVKFALRNQDDSLVREQCTIRVGDIVHRQIQKGDRALHNRQPTLHRGSMLGKIIVPRPFKTIRMNLATTSTFNADFDGDEMNLFFPQSELANAELELLASTEHNMIGAQSSNANIVIVQDALLGSFLMTSDTTPMTRAVFHQLTTRCSFDYGWIDKKIQKARDVYASMNLPLNTPYTGKVLFSLLLPENLNYTSKNKAIDEDPVLVIQSGIVCKGAVNKVNLKGGHTSLICILHKYYSNLVALEFVNDVQFLANEYMMYVGFSIGIQDCILHKDRDSIEKTVTKCMMEAKEYESIKNERVREAKINLCLSKARDIGMRLAKESLGKDNNFVKTVTAGSKGDYFNIAQIMGLLGQQNIGGQRIHAHLNQGTRTLPHYPINQDADWSTPYFSRGFIQNSFLKGLSPQEFWFHAMSGREGVTDTAMKTAHSGYTMRRMVKIAEDVKIQYDGTVRDVTGSIVQFIYGGDGLCGTKTTVRDNTPLFCDVQRLVSQLD